MGVYSPPEFEPSRRTARQRRVVKRRRAKRKQGPRPGSRNDVGYAPLDGSEPDIVFGANFNGDTVDVTGNYTFQTATPTTFDALSSVDNLRSTAELPVNSTGRIYTASGSAASVATASGVTYGGMYYLDQANTLQPFPTLMFCGITSGATNGNYGLYVDLASDIFVRTPGTAENFVGAVPWDQWIHVAVTENPGRTSATLYINGSAVDTQALATTGVSAGASDTIWIGDFAGIGNTSFAGLVSDAFVCSSELSAAQVLQFATNAFGGTPPAVT